MTTNFKTMKSRRKTSIKREHCQEYNTNTQLPTQGMHQPRRHTPRDPPKARRATPSPHPDPTRAPNTTQSATHSPAHKEADASEPGAAASRQRPRSPTSPRPSPAGAATLNNRSKWTQPQVPPSQQKTITQTITQTID